MATTTQTFSGFFEPILREITNQSMREQPPEYPSVMREINFTKHTETFQEYALLGLAQDKAELAPIVFDDPIQGGRKEYQSRVKALGFKFSWEAEEDDKYGVVAETASSLGDSARESREIDAARLWNNAIAGDPLAGNQEFLTYDGLSICNDNHTRLDGGGLQDNLFTGDISLALLQSMRYHFRNLRTDRGFRNQGHKLNKVIITPDPTTEPLLDQILGGTGMQPFTADNTSHELGAVRTQIQKFVYSYMDDTDRTYGLSQKALNKKDGPFFANRRNVSMTSWDDDEIQASCNALSWRWSQGCPDWHGITGSGG